MPNEMYQMIADVGELKWFFDNVIQKPQVNESYSAVFVSRHKKLTDEEKITFGISGRESEFLTTQTFRLSKFHDLSHIDEENSWTFDKFLNRIRRFNVDKYAFTTSLGEPIPEKTLTIIFYVNPCDDIKVCREFFTQYLDVNQSLVKAELEGKTLDSTLQSYQWFGNADSNIKHLKAKCKGSRYWLDYDIDVPAWFKKVGKPSRNNTCFDYQSILLNTFEDIFGKGNYVVIDTAGGYHILVKTSVIKSNPHDVCKKVNDIYMLGLTAGETPYLDEKGNCKFECNVNDSQIPGIPLPGTYQYSRPVTILNKEDFI